MFSCSACVRRALVSLAADLPSQQIPSVLPLPTPFPRLHAPSRRTPGHYATSACSASTLRSLKKGHHRRTLVKALTPTRSLAPNARRNKALTTKVDRRNVLARENNEKHLAVPDYEKKLEAKAMKEAPFLVDPMRLADEVQRNLKNDNFDKAIALVRASEKQGLKDGKPAGSVNNIVSWNHLCDWCMAQRDPKTALKTYNEMKKRGHKPDAHTYTIMLRGFGGNIRKPNAVSDAMRVYNSMFEPNSKTKPNTIHTNAIIAVCAKGSQMDQLWSVAGRLPDKGTGGADHVTFTTILKAIERDAIAKAARYMAKEGEGSDAGFIFAEAVEDARKLWRDVIVKWRRADLRIDESLVCAMGRLLLLSKRRQDVLDVFKLVEQTMDVKLSRAIDGSEMSAAVDEQQQALAVFQAVPVNQLPAATGTDSSQASNSASPQSIYVQPGNNTLSMLMEAALLTKQPHIGKSYWNLLTSPNRQFKLAPDANNIVAYLRLLRFSRASADIVELLQRDWPIGVAKDLNRRGVYVIAMSACVRDKNNPNIFRISSKIVDIMQANATAARKGLAEDGEAEDEDESRNTADEADLESKPGMLDLDPKVMTMYLNLAMYTTPGINPRLALKRLPNGELDFERQPSKNNSMRALHRMGPDSINLRRILKMKITESDMAAMSTDRRQSYANRTGFPIQASANEKMEDLIGLVRAMISAYDRILAVNFRLEEQARGKGKGLDKDILIECRLQKAKLAAYLSKIDKKLIEKAGGGRSGLWEGYDPAKAEEKVHREVQGEVDDGVEEVDEQSEVERDTFLKRTVGGARLKKAVKQEQKVIEKEKEMREGERKRLSRRQEQEQEKERREQRLTALRPYDMNGRESRTETTAGRTRFGARMRAQTPVHDRDRSDARYGDRTRPERLGTNAERSGWTPPAKFGGRTSARPGRFDEKSSQRSGEHSARRPADYSEPDRVSSGDRFGEGRVDRTRERSTQRSERSEASFGVRSEDGFKERNGKRSSDRFAERSDSRSGERPPERSGKRDYDVKSSQSRTGRSGSSYGDRNNARADSDSFEQRSVEGHGARGRFERSEADPDRFKGRFEERPRDETGKRPTERGSSGYEGGRVSAAVQRGWGKGFEDAAREMGLKGWSGVVDLRR